MNDRAVTLLEQYDIEILKTRKGRGAILCDTSQGTLAFKEYAGTEARLAAENQLLQTIAAKGQVHTDTLLPTKEGCFSVKDRDGISYILKTYVDGRECDIYDRAECGVAMELLAGLHNAMESADTEGKCATDSALKEYEKRNRELAHIRSFLGKKGQKQPFERYLKSCMDFYLEQAKQITEGWRLYEEERSLRQVTGGFCHGDYQYHNILFAEGQWYVVNFEKCHQGSQVTDIYLLMRKLLEKSDWPQELGKELLDAYQKVRPIPAYDYIDLYYRLAYPEKFWKIANFYMNSRKSWIPEKNMEKLSKVLEQEEAKQAFLENVFGNMLFSKKD
ncbi:MAG: phosphotransferase [Lachnospiraceae bacterium]|nr:phosphotransferase [Lachnospiraceae bacterium]